MGDFFNLKVDLLRVPMDGEGRPLAGQGYKLLVLLFATYFVDSVFRAAPSALSSVIISEFALTYAQAGMVMSIYMLPYALMQVPGGIVSDRWGPRRTLFLFLTVTIIGNLTFWMAKGYWMLLAGQIMSGIGSSVIFINVVKVIEARMPQGNLGRGLGVLSAASPLGAFLSYSAFPLLYSMLDAWKPAYLGLTVVMMGVIALDALFIGDPEERAEAPHMGTLEMLRNVASNDVLVPLFVGYTISGFTWGFWSWMPKFLIDVKGFSYVEAGFITSIPTMASIGGCVLVGVVSDKLELRKLPLAVFAALDALMLAIIIFLPASTPIQAFVLSGAFLGVTSTMWVLPYAMVADVLPRNLSGVGLGLMNFLGYVGSIFMTPLFGALVDRTGSYTFSNQIVIAISLVVVLVYSAFVKETYPKSSE